MENEPEEKLKEFGQILKEKKNSSKYEFWKLLIVSPWQLFGIYRSTPTEFRDELRAKILLIFIIEILFIFLLGALAYLIIGN